MNESSTMATKLTSKHRFSKTPGKEEAGCFERLEDIETADSIRKGLWPRGYLADRETTVIGTDSHSALSEEITLGAIHVRNEVSISKTTVLR